MYLKSFDYPTASVRNDSPKTTSGPTGGATTTINKACQSFNCKGFKESPEYILD